MLLGTFIKNFKCYQGTQFVPAYANPTEKIIGYLGDNGVGKSAVLEALNVYFSRKGHWVRNKDSKKGASECFVAPVFLVNRSLISDISGVEQRLEEISSSLVSFSSQAPSTLPIDQLLVCVAKREDGTLSLYDGKKESSDEVDIAIAQQVHQKIIGTYKYIYINAEVDIDEEAKINSNIYEIIIGSPITAEVEDKFKEINESENFVRDLNATLERLIEEKLVSRLRAIDERYSYGGSRGAIANLTTNVLARASTQAFLDSRKLKLDNKQLDDLSSGQRRVALLDFIIAALEGKAFDQSKNLIFAIDEPEISLDASKKMGQFEKLIQIAGKEISVMFTSHWYGWTVNTDIGRSVFIADGEDNRKDIRTFLNSEFPFQDAPKYEMRMVFDFLMSLGAIVEANPQKKYIVCEGKTDLVFFSSSLNDSRYKIIPVTKTRVKRIADIFREYYWKDAAPLKNILFIVDTDPEQADDHKGNPYLRRWIKKHDFSVTLVGTGENLYTKCEVEDVLEPAIYLDALKQIFPAESFIQGLQIKYPTLAGVNAFGLDSVEKHQFEALTDTQKLKVAEKYKEIMLADYQPANILKVLIESNFTI